MRIMKMILRIVFAVPLSLSLFASEVEGARAALEFYLRGHATGNPEFITQAFHPAARIQGYRLDGQFADWSLEEYRKGFRGTPAVDEAKRKRSIDMVEVQGSAGVARATLDYPNAVFTDYFLLMKHGDHWKIMNKVFSVRAK
jgi:hypothetical protein